MFRLIFSAVVGCGISVGTRPVLVDTAAIIQRDDRGNILNADYVYKRLREAIDMNEEILAKNYYQRHKDAIGGIQKTELRMKNMQSLVLDPLFDMTNGLWDEGDDDVGDLEAKFASTVEENASELVDAIADSFGDDIVVPYTFEGSVPNDFIGPLISNMRSVYPDVADCERSQKIFIRQILRRAFDILHERYIMGSALRRVGLSLGLEELEREMSEFTDAIYSQIDQLSEFIPSEHL